MIKYISRRSDLKMANKYSDEERTESLKLADEIGASAAAQRLGIKSGHHLCLAESSEE
jgi:hypothetical protein